MKLLLIITLLITSVLACTKSKPNVNLVKEPVKALNNPADSIAASQKHTSRLEKKKHSFSKVQKTELAPLNMIINVDTRKHTVTISGGIYENDVKATIDQMAQDAIDHYIMSKGAYSEAIACDFENGTSTVFSSQPSTMRIIYSIDVYTGQNVTNHIEFVWLVGLKNGSYFSEPTSSMEADRQNP